MYEPFLEDLRWVETPSNVCRFIIQELKSIGVSVCATYFKRFVKEIAYNYNDLPFHNFRHVSHVTFMTLWILKHLKLLISSNDFECFALNMVVVSLGHDINHSGVINSRLLNRHVDNLSEIDFETQYITSSTSDNENMHSCCLIKLLKTYGSKIMTNYDLNTNLIFIHNCILATDLQLHDSIMQYFSLINNKTSLKSMFQKNPVCLGMMIMKCADLGHFFCHPAVHVYWVCKLDEEMCNASKEISTSHCESSIRGCKNMQKSYLQQLSETTITFCNRYVRYLHSEICNLLHINSDQLKKNTEIWLSIGPTARNVTYIDRMSADILKKQSTDRHSLETHMNVCICMIDIVNFTQWSSCNSPEDIFETMTLYNEYIIELIGVECDVNKIEMVGDSAMIIGGLRNGCTMDTKLAMFLFVSRLLSSIDRLKRLFNDNNISVRVGMHMGNIYIGCIEGPLSIQVYGNSVCVASRMESSAYPGTLMISDTLFDAVFFYIDILVQLTIGNVVNIYQKGVGNVNSMCIFLHSSHTLNILIADDSKLATKMIYAKVKKLVPDAHIKIVNNLREMKETLFMIKYDILFSDWNFQNGETVDLLIYEYLMFEDKYRKDTTRIVVFSTSFESEYRPDILRSLLSSEDVISRANVFEHLELVLKGSSSTRHSNDLPYGEQIQLFQE